MSNPSAIATRSRDERQWTLSTFLQFNGADFNGAADADNHVVIDLRPGTYLLRGVFHVLSADTAGTETYVSLGEAGDLENVSGPEGAMDAGTAGPQPIISYPASVSPIMELPYDVWFPEWTKLYLTYDNVGLANQDGQFLLMIEYAVRDRANEIYG